MFPKSPFDGSLAEVRKKAVQKRYRHSYQPRGIAASSKGAYSDSRHTCEDRERRTDRITLDQCLQIWSFRTICKRNEIDPVPM